jgi:hypothetical protein
MPNPISKSEAQFKLRNITAKLSIALSAAREGDWRIAFDNAYEAQDLLDILLPHLEEAADELAARRDKMPPPEPPGSLKYGAPPGTPERTERGGGLGYRGSSHSRPPEPITVDVTPNSTTRVPPTKRGVDLSPPRPIIITPPPPVVRGPIITPPPVAAAPPKPAAPAAVIPQGAEVVTLDINRLLNGIVDDADRMQMTLLYELPEAFRKNVLKHQALSRRPVTIYRVGDGAWAIYK